MNQAQPLECQQRFDCRDAAGNMLHQGRQTACGDHFDVPPHFSGHSVYHPIYQPGVAKDHARFDTAGRVFPDYRFGGFINFNPRQLGGFTKQRLGCNMDTGADGSAQVFPPG